MGMKEIVNGLTGWLVKYVTWKSGECWCIYTTKSVGVERRVNLFTIRFVYTISGLFVC